MTKLINVRVCVPTDNDVRVEAFIDAFEATLMAQPVTTMEEGRVHWSAVSVSRYVDRSQAPPPRKRAPKPSHQQQELPQE